MRGSAGKQRTARQKAGSRRASQSRSQGGQHRCSGVQAWRLEPLAELDPGLASEPGCQPQGGTATTTAASLPAVGCKAYLVVGVLCLSVSWRLSDLLC